MLIFIEKLFLDFLKTIFLEFKYLLAAMEERVMTSCTLRKPATTKQTEIWLIGQISLIFNATNFSSKKEFVPLFFYHKRSSGQAIRAASHSTANDVLGVLANIATRKNFVFLANIVTRKNLFRKYEKLKKKSKENKVKRSDQIQVKQNGRTI